MIMNNEKIQMVGYCRVSTATQNTERQVAELEEYAKRNNVKLMRVFAEQISGAVKNENRPELSAMVNYVISKPNVHKVIVWELSRLGRNTLEVLKMAICFPRGPYPPLCIPGGLTYSPARRTAREKTYFSPQD